MAKAGRLVRDCQSLTRHIWSDSLGGSEESARLALTACVNQVGVPDYLPAFSWWNICLASSGDTGDVR